MNKKLLIVGLILISLTFWTIVQNVFKNGSLLSPRTGQVVSSPIPTQIPSPAPKTFKFDKTTDLKKELDSIQPQLQDSDFE